MSDALPSTSDAGQRFLAELAASVERGAFVKLVLGKPRAGGEADLLRVTMRPIRLRGEAFISIVSTHKTRDITKNLPVAEAMVQLRASGLPAFGHAHLFTAEEELQLLTSRKGQQTLRRSAVARDVPADASPAKPELSGHEKHDREKQRWIALDRPFLAALGVTDAQGRLIPAMARKWKQINKFVEVLDHALASTALKAAPRIAVSDFGSGKGYLTFALHEHLQHTLGLPVQVTGVELRADMVTLCNGAAKRLGLEGLAFEQGDVGSVEPEAIDIMIALHACDTATDHAIHQGLRAGAAIIMCSPCCHKELRPQLLSPHPLRPILKHGVHLGQQAEMLTDGLRALLLDACGYETQVFEFIALEHTNKNKMILAVKRERPARDAEDAWQQVRDIKAFYGIRDQCLETLLLADRG